MKKSKKQAPLRGNEIKEAVQEMDGTKQYSFVPDSITMTSGELALILYLVGLTMTEEAYQQLPVYTRRHFRAKE